MIVLDEICDDAGACESIATRRRGSMRSKAGSLRQVGSRRAEGSFTTIKFTISAKPEQAASLVDAINDQFFSSYLAYYVATGLEAENIWLSSLAAEVIGTEKNIDKAIAFEGWIYDFRNRGESHLVKCPPGRIVVNSSTNTQTCLLCSAGTYSFNSTDNCDRGVCNERQCNDCPVGARCNGGNKFQPLIDNSDWLPIYDGNSTKMRVQTCPPGHVLVRNPGRPANDECAACLTNTYRLEQASFATLQGVTDTQATREGRLDLCLTCPTGSTCPGKAEVTRPSHHIRHTHS